MYLPPHVCTLCVLIQRQSVLTRDWCKGGLVIKEVHTQEKIHKIWKNYRPKHLKLLRYSICWRFRFYTKYQSLCLLFGSSWLPPMAGKPTLYRPHRCKVAAVPDQQKWIKAAFFNFTCSNLWEQGYKRALPCFAKWFWVTAWIIDLFSLELFPTLWILLATQTALLSPLWRLCSSRCDTCHEQQTSSHSLLPASLSRRQDNRDCHQGDRNISSSGNLVEYALVWHCWGTEWHCCSHGWMVLLRPPPLLKPAPACSHRVRCTTQTQTQTRNMMLRTHIQCC